MYISPKTKTILLNSLSIILAIAIIGFIRNDDVMRIWNGIQSSHEHAREQEQQLAVQTRKTNEADALYQTALSDINADKIETAIITLEDVLWRNEEHKAARIKLAELYLGKSKFNKAYTLVSSCPSLECKELSNKIEQTTLAHTEKNGFKFENFNILQYEMAEQLKTENFNLVSSCTPVAVMSKLARQKWSFANKKEQDLFANWVDSLKPADDDGGTSQEVADTTPQHQGELGDMLTSAQSTLRGTMAQYQLIKAHDNGKQIAQNLARYFAEDEFNQRDCRNLALKEFSSTAGVNLNTYGGTGNFHHDQARRDAKARLNQYSKEIFRYQVYSHLHQKCLVEKSCSEG